MDFLKEGISDLLFQVLGHKSPVRFSEFNTETNSGIRVSFVPGEKIKIDGKTKKQRMLSVEILRNGKIHKFDTAITGLYGWEEREVFCPKYAQEIVNKYRGRR